MADSGRRVESRGGQRQGSCGNRILAQASQAHVGTGLEGVHEEPRQVRRHRVAQWCAHQGKTAAHHDDLGME